MGCPRYNLHVGLVFVRVGVAHVAHADVIEVVECLVDSGTAVSVIPRPVLEKLGVEPYRKDSFGLANGEFIERDRGVAKFSYETHAGIADVLFGESGDACLLGMTTLERMGLMFDPFRRELREMPPVVLRRRPHGGQA